jgi:hypothetical protein
LKISLRWARALAAACGSLRGSGVRTRYATHKQRKCAKSKEIGTIHGRETRGKRDTREKVTHRRHPTRRHARGATPPSRTSHRALYVYYAYLRQRRRAARTAASLHTSAFALAFWAAHASFLLRFLRTVSGTVAIVSSESKTRYLECKARGGDSDKDGTDQYGVCRV